jgi:hypothetical protein
MMMCPSSSSLPELKAWSPAKARLSWKFNEKKEYFEVSGFDEKVCGYREREEKEAVYVYVCVCLCGESGVLLFHFHESIYINIPNTSPPSLLFSSFISPY